VSLFVSVPVKLSVGVVVCPVATSAGVLGATVGGTFNANSIASEQKADPEVPPHAIEVPVSPESIDITSKPVVGVLYPTSARSV
jgi:hypothetical protein